MKKFLYILVSVFSLLFCFSCSHSAAEDMGEVEQPKKIKVGFSDISRNIAPQYVGNVRYEVEISTPDGEYLATIKNPGYFTEDEYKQILEKLNTTKSEYKEWLQITYKAELAKENPDFSEAELDKYIANMYEYFTDNLDDSYPYRSTYKEYLYSLGYDSYIDYYDSPYRISFEIAPGKYKFEIFGYNNDEYIKSPETVSPVVYGSTVSEVKIDDVQESNNTAYSEPSQSDSNGNAETNVSNESTEEAFLNNLFEELKNDLVEMGFASDSVKGKPIPIKLEPKKNEYAASAEWEIYLVSEMLPKTELFTATFRYTTLSDYLSNGYNAEWIEAKVEDQGWFTAEEDDTIEYKILTGSADGLTKGNYYFQWVFKVSKKQTDNTLKDYYTYQGDIFELENGLCSSNDGLYIEYINGVNKE